MDTKEILDIVEARPNRGIVSVYREELLKRKILEMYFDFSGNRRRTFEEIADELGVDRRTVWYTVKDITKTDLEEIVPVWATNIAVQDHIHSNIPALINNAMDIGLGRTRASHAVQLKAIQWLASLAGVSAEMMQKQTDNKQQSNAVMVSVTVGGVPQQAEFVEAEYSELD